MFLYCLSLIVFMSVGAIRNEISGIEVKADSLVQKLAVILIDLGNEYSVLRPYATQLLHLLNPDPRYFKS